MIELNRAFSGGGILTAITKAVITNNTISDNTADFGGGVAAARSEDPLVQMVLTNNLISFNYALLYGGGGLATSYATPSVSYNDLYGNQPNDVDGDHIDADYIGVDGNISSDPQYVSRVPGARDLQLTLSSPAIDSRRQLGNRLGRRSAGVLLACWTAMRMKPRPSISERTSSNATATTTEWSTGRTPTTTTTACTMTAIRAVLQPTTVARPASR